MTADQRRRAEARRIAKAERDREAYDARRADKARMADIRRRNDADRAEADQLREERARLQREVDDIARRERWAAINKAHAEAAERRAAEPREAPVQEPAPTTTPRRRSIGGAGLFLALAIAAMPHNHDEDTE